MGQLSEEWVRETERMFDAMKTEIGLLGEDIVKLKNRVMGGYVVDPPGPIEPPDPTPPYVPPEVGVTAQKASVKEG